MQFSTIFFAIALSVTAALAGPVNDAGAAVTVGLEPAAQGTVRPSWSTSVASVSNVKPYAPAGAAKVSAGKTLSLRSEHNELEERQSNAVLVLCYGLSCTGGCYGYSLAAAVPYRCYQPTTPSCYKSAYVSAAGGLNYGVFVANNCAGTLLPYVNTCYNLTPQGNTFFIN